MDCRTKYPIVLVHGIGYNDTDYPRYWGRIPEALENSGAVVFFGEQDGFGSIRTNAGQLRVQLALISQEFGYEKFNLIAHSKGGLDARYMISMLDKECRVATLTTVATPHRGIEAIDYYKNNHPKRLERMLTLFNAMLKVDGGDAPYDNSVYDTLTADYMEVFNDFVKDRPDVYYQSYAFDMKGRYADPAMAMFYNRIKNIEGDNDGLVSVESAKWGNFRGVYSGPEGKGISHPEACDGREKLSDKRGLGNISDFYCKLVSELREMGF